MDEKLMKVWIDNASYEELLRKWRFEGAGSLWFTGEVGKHFTNVMAARRKKVGDIAHAKASKKVGWASD